MDVSTVTNSILPYQRNADHPRAIIICSETVRSYLINYARPLIYTTFMSFPSLAAIRAVYDLMMKGETVEVSRFVRLPKTCTDNLQLSRRLFELIDALHTELQRICAPNELLTIPPECPKSPIFALLTPQPRELAKYCQDAGFVVRAVVPPTIPRGTERVRVCLHAGNNEAEIFSLVGRVQEWVDSQLSAIPVSTDTKGQLVAKL